jgi:lipoyl(octanoyl) transferase
MAVDDALLASVQGGAPPVLRFYAWEPACLSFGRNQRAAGVYDPAALQAAGVDVVRRPTGGLAVLHDQELTYSVIVPAGVLGGPRAAYGIINQALVRGLRRLGVPATVAATASAPDPVGDAASPCFAAPASGEIMAGGRKLVGSAQRAERRVLLQHGSILLDGSQQDVTRFLAGAAGAPDLARTQAPEPAQLPSRPPSGSITLRELLGAPPPLASLVSVLAAAFMEVLGTPLAPDVLSAGEQAAAARIRSAYEAADWTWRC